MNSLAKLLEAALFASPRPIPTEELAGLDDEASRAAVQSALDELREHYNVDGHGVELVEQGGGWQILTRPEYTEAIERAQMAVRPHRLSGAALETLAIIAYRQPITLPEIQDIRGVNSSSVLKTLFEKKLITTAGKKAVVGMPFFYKTTPDFLMRFGLNELTELPRPEDLDADLAATVEAREIAAPTAASPSIHVESDLAQIDPGDDLEVEE